MLSITPYEFSCEEISSLTKTARSRGVMDRATVVTKWTGKFAHKETTILDFGSGVPPAQTVRLNSTGLKVIPYDFGFNEKALRKRYDIVMASNVLNVQDNKDMLRSTLKEMSCCVSEFGFILANYPKSPRRIPGLTEAKLIRSLKKLFGKVEKLPDRTLVLRLYP